MDKLIYTEENKFGLNQEQFANLTEYILDIANDKWYNNITNMELAKALGFEYEDYYQREEED